jgi:phosphohistidine phosphatase
MHMLHLLRHAKSSWKEEAEDHERALSRRGREAARSVGRYLPAATGRLDLVLCSSARRTRETMGLALGSFAALPRSLIEDGLYLAGCTSLFGRLRRLDEKVGNVLLIGHNPGLHELAVALAAFDSPDYRALATGKFPTAALASFRVATSWAALDRSPLVGYVVPKSLDED